MKLNTYMYIHILQYNIYTEQKKPMKAELVFAIPLPSLMLSMSWNCNVQCRLVFTFLNERFLMMVLFCICHVAADGDFRI